METAFGLAWQLNLRKWTDKLCFKPFYATLKLKIYHLTQPLFSVIVYLCIAKVLRKHMESEYHVIPEITNLSY